MEVITNHFGGLKANAGKIGEISFEMLLENIPSILILKNIEIPTGGVVEFMIELNGNYIPVDSKCTNNHLSYLKKEIPSLQIKSGYRKLWSNLSSHRRKLSKNLAKQKP
jgi:hypothetical protein